MLDIISKTQNDFALGRQITDSVLVAYELIHYLRHKRDGKKGFMSLKHDMSKTYDRIEWDYQERVLVVLGFQLHLIKRPLVLSLSMESQKVSLNKAGA